jgi:hypothetical protein
MKYKYIYKPRNQVALSAQGAPIRATKVYMRIQLSYMIKQTLVDTQTEQRVRPPVMIVNS